MGGTLTHGLVVGIRGERAEQVLEVASGGDDATAEGQPSGSGSLEMSRLVVGDAFRRYGERARSN